MSMFTSGYRSMSAAAETLTKGQGEALVVLTYLRRGVSLVNAVDWRDASAADLAGAFEQTGRQLKAYRAQAECGGRVWQDYRDVRKGRWVLHVTQFQRAQDWGGLAFFFVEEARWACPSGEEFAAGEAEVAALAQDIETVSHLDDAAAQAAVDAFYGEIRPTERRLWIEGAEVALAATCESATGTFRAALG